MDQAEIRVKGKTVKVPAVRIDDRTVIVTGRWLKVAAIDDEMCLEGDVVPAPERFLARLREAELVADILTFPQRLPETKPKYPYPYEWDNAAAIPITTYEDWFAKRAATDVRQNVKKSVKRGVSTRTVPFDDQLVRGIHDIFNESPIRQGRPFWHYGKDFETVKRETSHCLDRSEFIGAYCQDELIGFIKLLYTGKVADVVIIVSKQKHFDKRPTNALLAKAVEVCVQRRISFLTYAKFSYGNKTNSSLADFKRHHGFEQVLFPRYYIPLTLKGKIAERLKLYRNLQEMLPEKVIAVLVKARSRLYKGVVLPLRSAQEVKESNL
jgi:hypothetical protein